jgi:hypothetical protein
VQTFTPWGLEVEVAQETSVHLLCDPESYISPLG